MAKESERSVDHKCGESAASGASRFALAARRINGHPDYDPKTASTAPLGSFCGRSIIGESTPIHGGIYLSAEAREAIVVDEKHGLLDKIYTELTLRYARKKGSRGAVEKTILPQLWELVRETLPNDDERLDSLIDGVLEKPDKKLALDLFIEEGVGATRHRVLLAAYLLEKLRFRKLVEGYWSIDSRYSQDGVLQAERLIYTRPDGYIFIFHDTEEASDHHQISEEKQC